MPIFNEAIKDITRLILHLGKVYSHNTSIVFLLRVVQIQTFLNPTLKSPKTEEIIKKLHKSTKQIPRTKEGLIYHLFRNLKIHETF